MLSVEPSAFDPSKRLPAEPALLNGASHNYKESCTGITYADALAHPQHNDTIPHCFTTDQINPTPAVKSCLDGILRSVKSLRIK